MANQWHSFFINPIYFKLDCGVTPLAGTDGEFTAQGLDDLNNRCKEYRKLGARFAKWRCIYKVKDGCPDDSFQ